MLVVETQYPTRSSFLMSLRCLFLYYESGFKPHLFHGRRYRSVGHKSLLMAMGSFWLIAMMPIISIKFITRMFAFTTALAGERERERKTSMHSDGLNSITKDALYRRRKKEVKQRRPPNPIT